MYIVQEEHPYTFEEGIFECSLHLTQRQLDDISLTGFYEVHRGKLRVAMQKYVQKEVIENRLRKKALPFLREHFFSEIYIYFKKKVEQYPHIMGEYIQDVMLMSTTEHEKNLKRHKRILELPRTEYANLMNRTQINYNGNKDDMSEWYVTFQLENKLVIALHPSKVRLLNTQYNFVIARARKATIDSTGEKEFMQFISKLYKKDFVTKQDALLLKQIFTHCGNLTKRPLKKLM